MNIPRGCFEERSSYLEDLGVQFKVVRWVKQKDGLSLSHTIVNQDDPQASAYCVLFLKEKDAHSFIEATEVADHKMIGQLLGFPECCVDAFCQRTQNFDQDPILFQAENSKREEDITELPNGIKHRNITLINSLPSCVSFFRYWDLRQSFHSPCRFNCIETQKLFEKQLPLMKQVSSSRLDRLLKLVSHPVVWTGYQNNRVVYAKDFKKTFSTISLDEFTTINYFPKINGQD